VVGSNLAGRADAVLIADSLSNIAYNAPTSLA
jgi:hypothetical protein